jgi:hypothetical protein
MSEPVQIMNDAVQKSRKAADKLNDAVQKLSSLARLLNSPA